MKVRLLLPIAVLCLTGCASHYSAFGGYSGYDMEMESEGCRADAATQINPPGAIKDQSAAQRQAAYDHVYRDCMAGRGYQLSANMP